MLKGSYSFLEMWTHVSACVIVVTQQPHNRIDFAFVVSTCVGCCRLSAILDVIGGSTSSC